MLTFVNMLLIAFAIIVGLFIISVILMSIAYGIQVRKKLKKKERGNNG